jgi:hypothetical protein
MNLNIIDLVESGDYHWSDLSSIVDLLVRDSLSDAWDCTFMFVAYLREIDNATKIGHFTNLMSLPNYSSVGSMSDKTGTQRVSDKDVTYAMSFNWLFQKRRRPVDDDLTKTMIDKGIPIEIGALILSFYVPVTRDMMGDNPFFGRLRIFAETSTKYTLVRSLTKGCNDVLYDLPDVDFDQRDDDQRFLDDIVNNEANSLETDLELLDALMVIRNDVSFESVTTNILEIHRKLIIKIKLTLAYMRKLRHHTRKVAEPDHYWMKIDPAVVKQFISYGLYLSEVRNAFENWGVLSLRGLPWSLGSGEYAFIPLLSLTYQVVFISCENEFTVRVTEDLCGRNESHSYYEMPWEVEFPVLVSIEKRGLLREMPKENFPPQRNIVEAFNYRDCIYMKSFGNLASYRLHNHRSETVCRCGKPYLLFSEAMIAETMKIRKETVRRVEFIMQCDLSDIIDTHIDFTEPILGSHVKNVLIPHGVSLLPWITKQYLPGFYCTDGPLGALAILQNSRIVHYCTVYSRRFINALQEFLVPGSKMDNTYLNNIVLGLLKHHTSFNTKKEIRMGNASFHLHGKSVLNEVGCDMFRKVSAEKVLSRIRVLYEEYRGGE